MPDAAQFTMNLFDTTALGWTVAAPEPEPSAETEKDDDAPEAPAALSHRGGA